MKKINLKHIFINLFGSIVGCSYYNHFYNYGGRVRNIVKIEISDDLRIYFNDGSISLYD